MILIMFCTYKCTLCVSSSVCKVREREEEEERKGQREREGEGREREGGRERQRQRVLRERSLVYNTCITRRCQSLCVYVTVLLPILVFKQPSTLAKAIILPLNKGITSFLVLIGLISTN